jgi:hypothetical protein
MILGGSILITGPAAAAGTNAPPEDTAKQQHESVTIGANNEFNPANAVRSGMGTRRDPFVISGWEIDTLRVHDTSKYVVIRDNNITGTLVLDWVGNRVTVVNNTVGDLRVNQNVERTGDMTNGVIAHNTFGVVGQLRHWDGVFAHNVVGSPDSMDDDIPFTLNEAVNFDGFNGAHFRNNTIYGFVNATLHGHHHSSGYGEHSHNHAYQAPAEGEDAEHSGHDHDMADMDDGHDIDHSIRYDEVFISNNKIYASGPYALRYTDQNHAANDRTATSETNPELNQPHVHHTHVFMTGNKLIGSGIEIDVFNADDERHLKIGHGSVTIKNNDISLARPTDESILSVVNGIGVRSAQGLDLYISGNSVTEEIPETNSVTHETDNDSGIYLENLDEANVYIARNSLSNTAYGVLARDMSKTVNWWITGLKTTGVAQPVYYDNSVANQPRRQP